MLRALCAFQCRCVRRQSMTHAEETNRAASMMCLSTELLCSGVVVSGCTSGGHVSHSVQGAVLQLPNVASVMEQQQTMRTWPMRTATRLRDKVCLRQLLAS